MLEWFKRVLGRFLHTAKKIVKKAFSVTKTVVRSCTATRLRRNITIAVGLTAMLAVVGSISGVFAAANAIVSMGFIGQAIITSGGITLLGLILAATQFGISTGGGGVLMLFSLATGQYYIALMSAVIALLGFAGLAGIASWILAAMLHAPGWVTLALAYCFTHPIVAVLCSVAAIVVILYVAEYVIKLAFKLVRFVWQAIVRRNVHLLPAPV